MSLTPSPLRASEFEGDLDVLGLPSVQPLLPQADLLEALSLPTALWKAWTCLLLNPSDTSQAPRILDHGQDACEGVARILGAGTLEPAILELYAQQILDTYGYLTQAECLEAVLLLSPAERLTYLEAHLLLWDAEDALEIRDGVSAEDLATQGMAIADAVGDDHLRAEFYDRLGLALAYQDRLDESETAFQLATLYALSTNDLYLSRRSESNLATQLTRREGNPEAVQAAFREFFEARLASGDLEGLAVSLRKLATRNYNSDNLLEASAQARDAITIARYLDDDLLTGKALTILGHTLDELGDIAGSRSAYRQALELLPTSAEHRRYWINAFSAQLQFELGRLEDEGDDTLRHEQLEALSAQAARAVTFAEDMSSEQLLELHLNRSRLGLAQGRWEEGSEALDAARRLAREGRLHNWDMDLNLQTGRVALAAGALEDARAAFEEARNEAESQGQLATQWRALQGLASVYQAQGDRSATMTALGQAAGVVEGLWTVVDGGRGESQGAGARFLESQIGLYDRAVETLLAGEASDEDRLEAWWWSERRRTGTLRRQLGTLDDGPPMPSSALAAEWLAGAQAQLAASDGAGEPSILISYQLSPRASFAFVITADALIVRALPLDGAALTAQIDAALPFLITEGEDGRRLPVEPAHLWLLSEALWLPISDLVPPGALLRIIPDGRITLLPFELLPLSAQADAPVLLSQHAVVYGATTQELIGIEPKPPLAQANLLSLAIGRAIPVTPTHGRLPPLPCAIEEGERLVQGPGDRLHSDDAATETRFRAEAPHYDILHLAVHGVISENRYHRSHLVLSPDAQGDGLLTLPEIASLELNARLALLPACQSAVARIFRGEGAQGVGSAFREAGVDSTVVGLWELPDVVGTVEIVDRMVRYLEQGMGTAAALRRAKLDVLRAGASPRTWAPLVLYGASEAIFEEREQDATLPKITGEMDQACEADLLTSLKRYIDRALSP